MIFIVSLILLLIDSIIVIKMLKNEQFHLLLRFFLAISFFGWNATPYVLSLLPQYRGFIGINYELYLGTWAINFFFLLIVFLTATFFNKRKWRISRVFESSSYQYNPGFIRQITYISLIALVFIIIIGLGNEETYADRNDVSNHDENLFLGIVSFFSNYAVYLLLAVLFFYQKMFTKSQQYLIFGTLSVHYIMLTLGGGRIHLFAIVFMLVYIAMSQNKKRLMIPVFAAVIVSLTVLPVISELRSSGKSFTTSDVMKTQSSNSGDVLWEVMNKTNSVGSSSKLLIYGGIGTGGSLVYTSTLYSLVPRFIYPSKPHPGSMDGTMDGLPGRLAANIDNISYSSAANVGISTSIEALWAGGVFMYIIQALFSGLLIVFMNMAIKGKKLLFLYFVLSLLAFPVCVIDVSIVNFSIAIQRFFITLLFFNFIFSRIYSKTKLLA